MRSLLFILFLILYAKFDAWSQYSSLKEFGFHGKVKSVTIFNFDSLVYSGKILALNDTIHYKNKNTLYYNKSGLVDSIKYEYRTNHGVLKLVSIATDSATYFTFSELNNTTKILIEKSMITWIDDDTYILKNYDIAGNLISQTTVWKGKNGREFKNDYKEIKNDTITFYEENECFYDENNFNSKTILTDIIHKISYTIVYEHTDFDNQNNPLRTVSTNVTLNSFRGISIRRFEYY